MALTKKLTDIAEAIRTKTGKTDLLTLEQMPTEIAAIETGGGGEGIPEEAFIITGECTNRFCNDGWDWFLENYGNKITTQDLKTTENMFYNSKGIEEIPFDFNFNNSSHRKVCNMFYGCSNLKTIGKIINLYPSDISYFFNGCIRLRELPEFVNLNMDKLHTYSYGSVAAMFSGCGSLRVIPENFLKELYVGTGTSAYYCIFYNGFQNCYVLDEIRGLNPQTGTMTSNMFSNTFQSCHRVKDIIFATQEDGTPYTANWKSQTINLNPGSNYGVGFGGCLFENDVVSTTTSNVLKYNSGITADKAAFDDATYQAVKNDPDWFAGNANYSRYNHDSAVNTINSLPDTSAYLATAGGTNTIKFYGAAGSATDGGAINTLTEAEIAVAAAKGWTVTLA